MMEWIEMLTFCLCVFEMRTWRGSRILQWESHRVFRLLILEALHKAKRFSLNNDTLVSIIKTVSELARLLDAYVRVWRQSASFSDRYQVHRQWIKQQKSFSPLQIYDYLRAELYNQWPVVRTEVAQTHTTAIWQHRAKQMRNNKNESIQALALK
jgi:hypothetical protein